MKIADLTEQERIRMGVAAAAAIKYNLPVDAFGQQRRLNDYADIWGAAARTAVIKELTVIIAERKAVTK